MYLNVTFQQFFSQKTFWHALIEEPLLIVAHMFITIHRPLFSASKQHHNTE